MLRSFILATILMIGRVQANEAPPIPEGGLQFLHTTPCADDETGEKGICYFAIDNEARQYIIFWQGDDLMFVREIVGDSYTTVWINDRYNSF
jgi:hypothetical protein